VPALRSRALKLTFDHGKSERNRRQRGIGFEVVERLKWSEALFGVSRAQNFDTSTRFFAVGPIAEVVHTVIFTFGGGGIRVISLRRASSRERVLWRASRTLI
jgi:hypothetical protein